MKGPFALPLCGPRVLPSAGGRTPRGPEGGSCEPTFNPHSQVLQKAIEPYSVALSGPMHMCWVPLGPPGAPGPGSLHFVPVCHTALAGRG